MTHFAESKSRRPEKAGESALINREKLLAEIEKGGEAAIAEGRVLSHEEPRERMSRWLSGESSREA